MSNENSMVERSEQPLEAPSGDSTAALINMVERASTNPDVDVVKLERLWAMYDAERNRQSEQAFNAALSKMQAQMPSIREGGEIRHSGKLISTYGRWDEDILPVIRPILREHGFGLRFHTETEQQVKVEAVLSHEGGHSERTSITLSPDTSGSKSGPQAVASSVSYGKRYTAASLLNLEIHGQDDDAQAASEKPKINTDQVTYINDLIRETKTDKSSFLAWCRSNLKANSIEELNQTGYEAAVEILERKKSGGKQ